MDRPMRSIQISNLLSDGRIKELRIHIYHFDDENGRCRDLGASTVYKDTPQSILCFKSTSAHKDNYLNADLSISIMTPFIRGGVPTSSHRIHALQASDALAIYSESANLHQSR